MDDKRFHLEKDAIVTDLHRVRAGISATAYLMGEDKQKNVYLEDLQLWFTDLSDRIDGAINRIETLRQGGDI
jgi:hypothetical protein